MIRPTVKKWGEARKMLRAFPSGDVYFDLLDSEGKKLDSAVPQEGEGRIEFAERVAADFPFYNKGAALPRGCTLIYREIYG